MAKELLAIGTLRRRARAFACVGLVVLGLFQVSVAAHEFTHVGDDALRYCHTCAQAQRLDAIPAEFSPAELPVETAATRSEIPAVVRLAVFESSYQSRAPPRS